MPPSARTTSHNHNNNSPRRHTYTTCHTSSTTSNSGRSRSHSCHSYSQQPYEAMMVSPPPPICTLPEASPLLDELFSRDATMLNLTPDTVEAIMMSLQIEREEMQLRQETEERATRSLLDTMLLEERASQPQQQQQPQQQPQRRRRQVQFQVQDSLSSSEVIEEEDEEPLEEEEEHVPFVGNGASFAAPTFRSDDFLFGGAEDLGRMIMPMPCDSNHSVTSNSGASQEGSQDDKTPPKYSYNNNSYDEKLVLSYKSSSSSVSSNGGDHHSCSSNDNGSVKSSEKKVQGGDLKSPPPESSAAAAAAAAASNNAANRTINKRDCQCLICHRFAADHRELRFKMLTPCGHVFCKTCVQDFLVKKKKCPYCRHPVAQRGTQPQEASSNSNTTSPMAA